jgi:DNA polymerase delta subunit 1
MKESIYGFSGNKKSPFIHIVTSSPTYINTAKRVLENGFSFTNGQHDKVTYSTFESNLPFIMRFMVDTKVRVYSRCTINTCLIILGDRNELD